jgi:hypothetical protein
MFLPGQDSEGIFFPMASQVAGVAGVHHHAGLIG